MSETKFTPGPWSRNIKPAKKYNTIFAGRNTHICQLSVLRLSDEEVEHNCNLIASAPEMYEALKATLQLNLHTYQNGSIGAMVFDRIRSAIAKADGKP